MATIGVRFRGVRACALCVAAALVLSGCLPPEAMTEVRVAVADGKAAAAEAKLLRSKVVEARLQIQELRAMVASGSIDPAEASTRMAKLTETIMLASDAAREAAVRAESAYKRAAAIKAKYGVAWWKVAGGVITALVQSYGGWGVIAGAVLGAVGLMRAGKWRQALDVTLTAIEAGDDKATKKAVATNTTPLLQKRFLEKKPDWEAAKKELERETAEEVDRRVAEELKRRAA